MLPLYLPEGHNLQPVEATWSSYFPFAHAVQEPVAALAAYLPLAQSKHALLAPLLPLPLPVHPFLPWVSFPAGQLLHLGKVYMNWPAAQPLYALWQTCRTQQRKSHCTLSNAVIQRIATTGYTHWHLPPAEHLPLQTHLLLVHIEAREPSQLDHLQVPPVAALYAQ